MDIIKKLKQEEANSVVSVLAMMSYIPSIGRVLEKGGVDKFEKIMLEEIKKIEKISSQDKFDSFHDSVIELIMKRIKTNKGEDMSYGQAQKPINVFFKVYIDWANKPTLKKSNHLRRLLHVPLDSIGMKEIIEKFPEKYKKYVVSSYDRIRDNLRKSMKNNGEDFSESALRRIINPSDFSLKSIIGKDMYYAWQYYFRKIHPEKPVLLDVFWALDRGS